MIMGGRVRALALSHPTLPEVTPHNGTAIAKVTPQKTGSHPTEANPTGTAASTNFSINKILYLKTSVPMRFVHGVSFVFPVMFQYVCSIDIFILCKIWLVMFLYDSFGITRPSHGRNVPVSKLSTHILGMLYITPSVSWHQCLIISRNREWPNARCINHDLSSNLIQLVKRATLVRCGDETNYTMLLLDVQKKTIKIIIFHP